MAEIVDSYKKSCENILDQLNTDPHIFLINSFYFRIVVALAPIAKLHLYSHTNYSTISLIDLIPNVIEELEKALPHPTVEDLSAEHFATELIAQYNVSWLPISSTDYNYVIKTNFREDLNMKSWQRWVRANTSTDIRELTLLTVDPEANIRNLAAHRLKPMMSF